MKKKILVSLATALVASVSLSLCGCSGEFKAKDAIRIEDIDWNVTSSIMDGQSFVSFNYTNKSKYTVMDVEMDFVQKSDVTAEQLSAFDNLKKRNWTDDQIEKIYIKGYNRKFADPGETVSDSPCTINGTYTIVENIKQYELMEPSKATISFIGGDGKGYIVYYDFKTKAYGESTQGGLELKVWSDSSMSKLLPKPEAPAIKVSSDTDTRFYFYAFGVSADEFSKYVDKVKAMGYTNVEFENNTSYRATNSSGAEAHITYTLVEETMTGCVEK